MTVDLSTRYLGLELRSPIVASASPATGHPDSLQELGERGVGAVVLPSLFEEEIERASLELHGHLEQGAHAVAEAAGGYAPEMPEYRTGPRQTLELLRYAKDFLDVPVIASLNGSSDGGWATYAKTLEAEGADALELNIYLVAADPGLTAPEVEGRYLQLVEHVRASTDIPLAVKIAPYFSAMGDMARRLADAGADGLVLFNRFYQPDIDLETLTVKPDLVLSTRAELRLVLRWMAILHGRIDADLAATSGVHAGEDVVKLLLAGADVVMMASALLAHGASHVGPVTSELTTWLADHDYSTVGEARGAMSQLSVPQPEAYERANYVKSIASFSSRYH